MFPVLKDRVGFFSGLTLCSEKIRLKCLVKAQTELRTHSKPSGIKNSLNDGVRVRDGDNFPCSLSKFFAGSLRMDNFRFSSHWLVGCSS